MVHTLSLMVKSTRVSGFRINNMAKEHIISRIITAMMAYGFVITNKDME